MMRKSIASVAILLFFFTARVAAQEVVDAVRVDTVRHDEQKEKKEGFFKKNYPDPLKAGLMSLVVPGSGQAYNKAWWKLPFVYGGLGAMVYFISFNTQQYNRFQTAYQLELKGEENEFTGTAIGNPTSLRAIRDGYDKNRQLSYVGLVFVYLLNGVEAFVDAHLSTFDTSEDLSFHLRPEISIDPATSLPALGLGVRIPLSQLRKEAPGR